MDLDAPNTPIEDNRRTLTDQNCSKTPERTNFIQINLNCCKIAQDLLTVSARNKNIQFAIISEPNKIQNNWVQSVDGKAAIAILADTKIKKHGQGNSYVWVETEEFDVYSVYLSPNRPTEELIEQMEEMASLIRTRKRQVIIGGDFNAKSPEWRSPKEDNRGRAVAETMATNELILLNEEGHTFERTQYCKKNKKCKDYINESNQDESSTQQNPNCKGHLYTAVLDLTWASIKISTHITSWEVLEEESFSDHRYISFNVETQSSPQAPQTRWDWRRFNEGKFQEYLTKNTPINFSAESMGQYLSAITSHCVPKTNISKPPVYWWTKEIAEARKLCNKTKRKIYRRPNTNSEEMDRMINELKENKRKLKSEILNSKKEKWKALLSDLDNDIWGQGYKIVCKRTGTRKRLDLSDEHVEKVIKSLFPTHPPTESRKKKAEEPIQELSEEELKKITKSIKTNKAPGPDNIPAKIIKRICEERPDWIIKVLNNLAKEEAFPKEWQEATLILLKKGDKPANAPSSYRPICLLNHISKLYEKYIQIRLNTEIENRGGISKNQFGFRKGMSTIHALELITKIVTEARSGTWRTRKFVMVISLDVKNAFNSVKWITILEEMDTREINQAIKNLIEEYFKYRIISYQGKSYEVTSGVAQGSVLAPPLWNLNYDKVFSLKLPEGVTLIGFADDLDAIIEGKTEEEIEDKAIRTIEIIRTWMSSIGLTLVPEKTQAVLISGRRKCRKIQIRLPDTTIKPEKSIKVLGVIIDHNLSFGPHIVEAAKRAERAAAAIARLLPNIGGPSEPKRKIIASVADSIMLYGAPIWAEGIKTQKYKGIMTKVQRKMALRIIRGYRTISTEAAIALASLIPVDLKAIERKTIYNNPEMPKKEIRLQTLDKMQNIWETSSKGRWTYRLIPNLKGWYERKHGETSYEMTQVLSGHGCFEAYLYKYKRSNSPNCPYCQNEEDTPEHTIFQCQNWTELREAAKTKMGKPLKPEEIIGYMLSSREAWETVETMARTIIQRKEKEQRDTQNNQRANRT